MLNRLLRHVLRLCVLGVVDYLPVATGGGATVDPQSTFNGSNYQINGMQNGIAQPSQANKVWRQSSMISAAVANLIANILSISVLDDGNLTNLIANLASMIRGASYKLVTVNFSATPVFDLSQGNVFEITLTGNVTSSTFINLAFVPGGTPVIFIIHQDGTGGRSFVPPTNVPMDSIDPTPSTASVQTFVIAGNQASVYATSAMIGKQ